MAETKQTEEKIEQLQIMEQNLRSSMVQRQTFQTQLLEVESALNEITGTEQTYKIIGNIMVAIEKKDLKDELEKKKEMLQLRIKSLEKQEEKLKERAAQTQKDVLTEMGKNEDKQ